MTPSGLRANTVIAGVNKAGTTSLFVSLASHPEVAAASVKETRYFLPARYGQPLEPVGRLRGVLPTTPATCPVRLEATPAYFYGDEPLIDSMRETLGPARVIVVLREPVSRLVSFFTSQKARLRIASDMSLAAYLAEADRLGAADFRDPANEPFFGFRGGLYADHLPLWLDAYSTDLRVLFFDDLVARPADLLADVAGWLGIDPDRVSRRRAQLREPNDRIPQSWRASVRARVQRSVREVPPPPPRPQGPAPQPRTTGSTGSRRASRCPTS